MRAGILFSDLRGEATKKTARMIILAASQDAATVSGKVRREFFEQTFLLHIAGDSLDGLAILEQD